jgi:hypothetical protein
MVIVEESWEPYCLSKDGDHKKLIHMQLFFVYDPYQVVKKKPLYILLYGLYPGVFHFSIMQRRRGDIPPRLISLPWVVYPFFCSPLTI